MIRRNGNMNVAGFRKQCVTILVAKPLSHDPRSFGDDLYHLCAAVCTEVGAAFPITIQLAAGSICLATFFGMTFCIICAIKQYSVFDNVTMIFAMLGISTPIFYTGILLILAFSVRLRWFPSSGFDELSQRILPWIALASVSMSIITRMTRSSMLEVVCDVDVFARTSPEHKLRRVKAIQANKQICAMTGDEVNDAPSLKQADIGVAVGTKGTEMTKRNMGRISDW